MPSKNSRETSVGQLLVEICRLNRSRMHNRIKHLGLHHGQPQVLEILWDEDGLTQGELAAQLQIRPATITKTVQRMEKAGFVQRRHDDPDDERLSHVYLTQAGHGIRDAVLAMWREYEMQVCADLAEMDVTQLTLWLSQIRDNLSDLDRSVDITPSHIH